MRANTALSTKNTETTCRRQRKYVDRSDHCDQHQHQKNDHPRQQNHQPTVQHAVTALIIGMVVIVFFFFMMFSRVASVQNRQTVRQARLGPTKAESPRLKAAAAAALTTDCKLRIGLNVYFPFGVFRICGFVFVYLCRSNHHQFQTIRIGLRLKLTKS